MDYVLFLDGKRHPETVLSSDNLRRYADERWPVLWAKDVAMAQWYLDQYGMPVVMHLDHDLGSEGGENGFDAKLWRPFREITAMDFLKWMETKQFINNYPPPEYHVHSQNPVGKQNIIVFMNSWHNVFHSPPL